MSTHKAQKSDRRRKKSNKPKGENSLREAIQSLTESESNRRLVVDKIYSKKLWKEREYKSFDQFVKSELNDICGRSTAHRLLTAARVDRAAGLKVGTIELSKAEELGKGRRCDEHIKQIWDIATQDLLDGKTPSLEQVKNAIASFEQVEAAHAFITTPEHHSYLINKAPQKNREALKKTLTKMQKLLAIGADG